MTNEPAILIVDDEPFNIDLLEQELDGFGYASISAGDGEEALVRLEKAGPARAFSGIILTDVKMPRMGGLELMQKVQELDPDLPVILVTAHGDISMAVQAIQDGAYDFIEKPINPERLSDSVRRALEKRALVLENRSLRTELESKSGIEAKLIGASPQMVALRKEIANLAASKVDVLIHGETGTGKEVVARCLHEFSSRSENHFVPVNCGGIPENIFESELFGHEPGAFTDARERRIGRIEYAQGGTLFLDEIESMPMGLQVKLLRVLEERVIERLGSNEQIPVDFRVVAAAKIDLKEAVKKGAFREDLYFRLGVAEVNIPPLRERTEDIPLLFEFFVQLKAARHERPLPGFSGEELNALMAHSWPGNVRELMHVAERCVLGLTGHNKGPADFFGMDGGEPLSFPERVEAFEKVLLEQSLSENKGNIQAAMEALGMPRRTLNKKMEKYGLGRKDFR